METKKVLYPRYYRQGKTCKLTKEEIDKIKDLRNSKVPPGEIARRFDVSDVTISYHTNPYTNERVKKDSMRWYRQHRERKRERARINMKNKRIRQNVEMRIYRRPNAKHRWISNEQFMKIIKTTR